MKHIFCYPGDFFLFEGEKIESVIRHHWLTGVYIWLKWFFWGPVLMGGALAAVYFLYPEFLWTKEFFLACYVSILFLIFYTIGAFVRWLNEIFDIIFVTNDRLIDITQIDFFHRTIAETRLENIQDATGNVKGFLNTIFNWGNISIQTASNTGQLAIENVENPQAEARKIFLLATQAKQQMLNKKSHPEEVVVNKVISVSDTTPVFLNGIRSRLQEVLVQK